MFSRPARRISAYDQSDGGPPKDLSGLAKVQGAPAVWLYNSFCAVQQWPLRHTVAEFHFAPRSGGLDGPFKARAVARLDGRLIA